MEADIDLAETMVSTGATSCLPEESGEIIDGMKLMHYTTCIIILLIDISYSPKLVKRQSSNNLTLSKPKRAKLSGEIENRRLPIPCPFPEVFSKTIHAALAQNELTGTDKLRMLRESASFFYGICPVPKPVEYQEMARTLCDKYPTMKDLHAPNGEYWVNVNSQ